jgi:hypothetical protein
MDLRIVTIKVIRLFKNYSHSNAVASPHFMLTAAAPMYHFARMQQSGGNDAMPVFPHPGNGFGLARLIGNAY